MLIETKLYNDAILFLINRYPKGWGGVAIIRTKENKYYTSVPIETANNSVSLCIEVGAICEAHKFNEKITHCICVVRDNESSPFKVLSPCGICQERLRFWGTDIKVGISTKGKKQKFVKLKELQRHHWTNAYDKNELESFKKVM